MAYTQHAHRIFVHLLIILAFCNWRTNGEVLLIPKSSLYGNWRQLTSNLWQLSGIKARNDHQLHQNNDDHYLETIQNANVENTYGSFNIDDQDDTRMIDNHLIYKMLAKKRLYPDTGYSLSISQNFGRLPSWNNRPRDGILPRSHDWHPWAQAVRRRKKTPENEMWATPIWPGEPSDLRKSRKVIRRSDGLTNWISLFDDIPTEGYVSTEDMADHGL